MTPPLWTVFAAALTLVAPTVSADPIACDMAGYKTAAGLAASMADNTLTVGWTGARNQELRLRFSIENGTPTIRELAIRNAGGAWQTLASNVVPDYRVVSGLRRMSNQQMTPLRGLGVELTDLAPMGSNHFEIPFNAAGKKWVRFAAWDSAGNGAMAQPVKLAVSRPYSVFDLCGAGLQPCVLAALKGCATTAKSKAQ